MEQIDEKKVAEAVFDLVEAASNEHDMPFFIVFGGSYMVKGDYRGGMIGAMKDRGTYVKMAALDCLSAIEKQIQIEHGQSSPPETE